MRIEMKSFACVAAVCCASLSLCAVDALPVSEDFESGTLASAWTGDGSISNVAHTYTSNFGSPMPGSANAKVLWVEGSAKRTYDDSNSQRRTMDLLVLAETLPDDDLPAAEGDEQFRLAFDSDGCLNLFHGYNDTSRWTKLSETAYPGGTWVRVTFKLEYPENDGRAMCQVVVDGSPCVTEYGYRDASAATSGGSWYKAAANGRKLSSVDFLGVGGVDELVFADSTATIQGGGQATNGVDYAWLIDNGIAAADVDAKASNTSAYTAKQSFDAGVDPYSSTPLYVTNATFSGENLTLTFNGYKDDAPTSYELKASTSPITASNPGTALGNVTFAGDKAGNTTAATVAIPSENSVTYIQVVATSGSVAATNQFGLLKVTSASTNTIIAAPWVALGANVENPAAMNVAKLVKTTNLTAGDQLILFDGTDYSSWVLNAERTAWEAQNVMDTSKPDVVRYPAGAANATLARGQGIWLVRKNPTDGGTPIPFYLYGQYTSAQASTTVAAGKTMLLANPNPGASFNLNSITPADSDDKVIVTGSAMPKVYTYSDSAWGYDKTTVTESHGETVQTKTRVTNENDIGAGSGFWYKKSGTSSNATTVNW